MNNDSYYNNSDGMMYSSSNANADPAVALVGGAIYLVFIVLALVILWKLFAKAGKPGWAAIVPIYNSIQILDIVGRPAWMVLLLFVPFLNFYVHIITMLDLAKSFGKSTTFGVLTIFFAPIMMAILAFDKNTKYLGPVSQGKTLEP